MCQHDPLINAMRVRNGVPATYDRSRGLANLRGNLAGREEAGDDQTLYPHALRPFVCSIPGVRRAIRGLGFKEPKVIKRVHSIRSLTPGQRNSESKSKMVAHASLSKG